MNWLERSSQAELLDGNDILLADLEQNLKEIDAVNRWLGGFAISCKGFASLAGNKKQIHLAEIGCGNGDNLRAIQRFALKKNIDVQITGIDIKEGCIALAESRPIVNAKWICSDYRTVQFEQPPDIIFSSLFCHHFSREEIVRQLHWMQNNSRIGFFINDLHRHPLAYYSIKALATMFSKSYLFKHDAPLSVARSFTRSDWEEIKRDSGCNNLNITWQWAFRHLITYGHNEP